MKFVNVLEHNGELYKIGDDIEATFDTGVTTSGKIKEFGSYGFLEEGLKEGIEFGEYTVSLDSIIKMKKIKHASEDVMNFAVAVLAEVANFAKQEDAPVYEGDKEVDQWVRLSDVNVAINKHLNESIN